MPYLTKKNLETCSLAVYQGTDGIKMFLTLYRNSEKPCS